MLIQLALVNGVLNVAWSGLFFTLQRPDWALYEVPALWLSILALVLFLRPISTPATLAMLPYLVWVAFAAVLNYVVVDLNGPF